MWTGIHRFNVISHRGISARMAVAARTNYFKPPQVAVISNRHTWRLIQTATRDWKRGRADIPATAMIRSASRYPFPSILSQYWWWLTWCEDRQFDEYFNIKVLLLAKSWSKAVGIDFLFSHDCCYISLLVIEILICIEENIRTKMIAWYYFDLYGRKYENNNDCSILIIARYYVCTDKRIFYVLRRRRSASMNASVCPSMFFVNFLNKKNHRILAIPDHIPE
jgi:hypothetical protein